jgi:hypothetical protein
MNIQRIKFYLSIKCSIQGNGKTEFNYIDTSVDPYIITLKDNLVNITHTSTNEETFTTLSNVVYFTKVNEKSK